MRHDSSGLLLCLRWWHWQVAPLHALMVFFTFLAFTGMWLSSCWDWIMQERLQLFKEYKEVWCMSDFACVSWNYDMFLYVLLLWIFFKRLHLCLFLQKIPRMWHPLWDLPGLRWSKTNSKWPSLTWVAGRESETSGRTITQCLTAWCLWWTPPMSTGSTRRRKPWPRSSVTRASPASLC